MLRGTSLSAAGNFVLFLHRYVDASLRSETDRTNVRASPVLRKDFTPLPPTLLLIAEVDPLKDSNYGNCLIMPVICFSSQRKQTKFCILKFTVTCLFIYVSFRCHWRFILQMFLFFFFFFFSMSINFSCHYTAGYFL